MPSDNQEHEEEDLDLIEMIATDPDAEEIVLLPHTPFPKISITPAPDWETDADELE